MECVDSNANTYIEKLDKLVLSMLQSDNESDIESSSSDPDKYHVNDDDPSDHHHETNSGQGDQNEI